jgi:hypothetical protein
VLLNTQCKVQFLCEHPHLSENRLMKLQSSEVRDELQPSFIKYLFVCFHGRPRQATDVVQPAGLLYRPLWTFQLWPPDAPAPTDAFRTLAAEVGTYGRGIGPVILPKCRLPRYILGIFYMPQICHMGPTALLPFRRKACWGFFRP